MNTNVFSRCKGNGQNMDSRTGLCGFRCEDWSEEFATEHEDVPGWVLFDAGRLVLGAPNADAADECRDLLRLQALRDRRREVQITAQAQSSRSTLLPLAVALGLGEYFCQSTPSLSGLIGDINENIRPPTFVFKRLFLRARPSRMCKPLRPMFPKRDALHPGHPAYPSGHSTMVYTWAYLMKAKLARRYSGLGKPLLAAAGAVAKNREWAGVHYASDTHAGQRLGKQMADAIIRGGELKKKHFEVLMPGLT